MIEDLRGGVIRGHRHATRPAWTWFSARTTSNVATPINVAGGVAVSPTLAMAFSIPLRSSGIGDSTKRFTELKTEVDGINHKMLTQNLRLLERNGLVSRVVHPIVPPRVDYTLTEPGQALRATVDAMCAWTTRYLGDIEEARGRFDR